MRKIRAAVVDATIWRAAMVGATVLVAAAVASAHAQSPQVPDTGGQTIAPTVPAPPLAGEAGSRPLFTIGKLEVHLWAPVEATYDAHMNHTAAANPMWESGE
jgi:hypothetical protein